MHSLAVWHNLEQFCSLCPLGQVGLQRSRQSWAPSSGLREGSREAPGGPAGGQAGPKRGREDVAGVEQKGVRRRADFLCSAMFVPGERRICLFTDLRSEKWDPLLELSFPLVLKGLCFNIKALTGNFLFEGFQEV